MTINSIEDARIAYSVKEVAALLGLNVDTVHDLVNRGDIRAIRVSPGSRGKYLISRDSLAAYLEGTSVP